MISVSMLCFNFLFNQQYQFISSSHKGQLSYNIGNLEPRILESFTTELQRCFTNVTVL